MKIVCKLEIFKYWSNTNVYVFKIEQHDFKKKKTQDIRKLKVQFDQIEEFYLFQKNISIDKNFKIFFFIISKSDYFEEIHSIIKKEKDISLANYFPCKKEFIEKNISSIVSTYINCYLKVNWKFEKMGNYYLMEKQNLFDSDNNYYTYIGIDKDSIKLDQFLTEGNYIYLKLLVYVECGLLKFKQTNDIYSIPNMPKYSQIYNKEYLSEIKLIIEESSNKIKYLLQDGTSNLRYNLNNYIEELVISYPLELKVKSKYFYPTITNFLFNLINTSNLQCSKTDYIKSLELYDLIIEDSDILFFDERMKLITEGENLKIYKNIKFNETSEHLRYGNILSFRLIYSEFLRNYTKSFCNNLLDNHSTSVYCILLTKHKNLFIINESSQILYIDESIKNLINLKILEFFAFIIHYNKSKVECKEKNDINRDINNTKYLISEINTLEIPFPNKKSLLKPFNKEEILSREECVVDYGDKKYSHKAKKIRDDYMKKLIRNANQDLFNEVESEIIQDTKVEEKQKRVTFSIPNDKYSILNKFN